MGWGGGNDVDVGDAHCGEAWAGGLRNAGRGWSIEVATGRWMDRWGCVEWTGLDWLYNKRRAKGKEWRVRTQLVEQQYWETGEGRKNGGGI